jgi:hypothetical protein
MHLSAIFFLSMIALASAVVNLIPPEMLTTTDTETFESLLDGTTLEVLFASVVSLPGLSFAERLGGQFLSSGTGFDVISPSPVTNPATLVANPNPTSNVAAVESNSVVVAGTLNSRIGEGAFAILFDEDQDQVGFDIVGASGGSVFVQLFGRDGTLLFSETFIVPVGLSVAFESTSTDIAAIVITNTDPSGVGFDNVRFDIGGVVVASGDPHLQGLFGINIEFFGEAGGAYSLITAPAFQVNMQLAQAGPNAHFMTKISVLFRNATILIEPWLLKGHRVQLTRQFAAIGAEVSFDGNWRMTVALCPNLELTFIVHHTTRKHIINFLNVELRAPRCHDAYGGALGQMYRCKWASEPFVWSAEQEESFRVKSLSSPSSSAGAPLGACISDYPQPFKASVKHAKDKKAVF